MRPTWTRAAFLLSTVLFASPSAVFGGEPAVTPQQLREDWLRQLALRFVPAAPAGKQVAPAEDAAGAVDGHKDGKWGFHTENESQPWWQVDLQEPASLERIVLYNRCDGGFAARNSRILVLLSADGQDFHQAYQHDGTPFLGHADGKPLAVPLAGAAARYVRLQLPGRDYFHLDEVEIYSGGSDQNIALHKPALQSSTSQWSARPAGPRLQVPAAAAAVVERGLKLADDLQQRGADVAPQLARLRQVADDLSKLPDQAGAPADGGELRAQELYFAAQQVVRELSLANPLLDFDRILFVKRAPTLFPHVSDQYYGWWSRPGGGLCLLEGLHSGNPTVRSLTSDWPAGNFLRPDLSYDGSRVVFAWCRHYPELASVADKTAKDALPEDAFYHLFEMNLADGAVRQLTFGRYDDFDGRYLPSGRIVFLSTRKGTALQAGRYSALATADGTCADSYVRCGGGNHRPVAVFTLHSIAADGKDLCAISAFENFEWTPAVSGDGRILYARWDYIDRFNGHFMSLWSTNPDGTNGQLVYGNYTTQPQCVFEARPIPGSSRLVFTATGHHSITGGSLVLLDRTRGTEFERPLTRLTPEVCFPETEGWPDSYYAAPWPLAEQYFLVSWSDRRLPPHSLMPADDPRNPPNASGIYLYDAFGNLNLLHRDPEISCETPIPVAPRPQPPALPDTVAWEGDQRGSFLVQDVYQGLEGVARGAVRQLRIVGVPPKVQPQMNQPTLGVSQEDPGKFVIGTVDVEADGSAYFEVPSGVSVFFQALDADGLAIQTMRSLTYVQPGQALACVGCHESRDTAPLPSGPPLALAHDPSPLDPGLPGSWPLRFDRLVQPVLDRHCVSCHRSDAEDPAAARLDLAADKAYQSLMEFGDGDLRKLAFERDRSLVGEMPARSSRLYQLLTAEGGHYEVQLDADDMRRLATWMDTYAQRLGSYSDQQERELDQLRQQTHRISAPPDEFQSPRS